MLSIYTKLAELKKEVGKMTKDSKNPSLEVIEMRKKYENN